MREKEKANFYLMPGKKKEWDFSLVIRWLRLRTSSGRDVGPISDQGTPIPLT